MAWWIFGIIGVVGIALLIWLVNLADRDPHEPQPPAICCVNCAYWRQRLEGKGEPLPYGFGWCEIERVMHSEEHFCKRGKWREKKNG
ncbi:MAG: hypothetical protein IJU01_04555 [Lachnospiraceae bacterium]|nr:hypothetical protein [Lachnospiraceae bacterium]